MRRLIVSSSYLSDSSVSSKDDYRSFFRLKSSIKKTKAFYVQHMNLIYEENSRNEISFILFLPLSNFLVDLIPDLWSDFSCLSREKSHKSLWSWIDNINIMKSNGMYYFFSFENFSFGTLSESCLRRHSIIFRSLSKTSS